MQDQASQFVTTGKRSSPRARIGLQATLETLESRRSVLLENISATGARIQLADPPRPGSDVIIQCGQIDVMARVTWASRDTCGIHFDDPAKLDDILQLKAESERIARSGYTHAQVRAAEDWQSGHVD